MYQRKHQLLVTGVILAAVSVLVTCNEGSIANAEPTGEETTKDAEVEVRTASDQFYAALNRMFVGDMAPLIEIWSHSDDVTNLGPFGSRQEGGSQVRAQFEREAGLKLGGRVVAKDVLVRVNGDTAYTVCVEQGENVDSSGKPIQVSHRATNVFRRESGKWQLVHHHTDISEALQKAGGQNKK